MIADEKPKTEFVNCSKICAILAKFIAIQDNKDTQSAVQGDVKLEEIRDEEVERAMNKMKRGRATGIDEVGVEMLVMTECVGVRWTRGMLNTCMREGKIPGSGGRG